MRLVLRQQHGMGEGHTAPENFGRAGNENPLTSVDDAVRILNAHEPFISATTEEFGQMVSGLPELPRRQLDLYYTSG